MKRAVLPLALALASLSPRLAGATGFGELGQDIPKKPDVSVRLDGYFRMRAEALYDLDLSRGPTPSGQLLFPRPADPTSHTLTGGDMRLRTDLTIAAPGGSLAVKARIDTFDDVALGSGAAGNYGAATSQQPPASAVRVKHAYGLALTPLGVIAAGRMGNHFGLGMLANGGDCPDCDSGDSADRVAFLMPLVGHVFALAYDFSATGPTTARKDGVRAIDIEPSDDVHTLTAVAMRFEEQAARDRRRRAGKTTVEYGAYGSHRWQKNDIPASYLPTAQPTPFTAAQVVYRGYTASAASAWLRVAAPWLRVEAEAALLVARVDQPSLIPGASFRQPVKSRQLGAALETEAGSPDGPFGGGVDAGYASGDPAPGFGANPAPNAAAPRPGDLDGPQANPPRDNRVDNFRFHPDYRVDRILFREIIGTVTDAVYLRPHVRVRVVEARSGRLTASLAAIWSSAIYASSTPGGAHALGTELDPSLVYESKDGFSAALEHGIFFPGAGLDNPAFRLPARTAQVFRLRMMFRF